MFPYRLGTGVGMRKGGVKSVGGLGPELLEELLWINYKMMNNSMEIRAAI